MHGSRNRRHEGNRDRAAWSTARYEQEIAWFGIIHTAGSSYRWLMGEADSRPQLKPTQPSDESALQRMRYGLEPVMGPQLLIDVMEMIAQRLWADSESLGDSRSIISRCEHPQNLKFL